MPSPRGRFRGDRGWATLDRWGAEAAPELDTAPIGPDVANPHEEGATAAVVDDAGVVGVPFAAQPNRAADHAKGEVLVHGKRASPGAAAAPGRQAALAHGNPAARIAHQGLSADDDHREARAHRHPVRKPALFELNDQLNAAVAVQEKGIGPRAVGQARVDLNTLRTDRSSGCQDLSPQVSHWRRTWGAGVSPASHARTTFWSARLADDMGERGRTMTRWRHGNVTVV